MSSPNKLTIVIISGGWHIPASYTKLSTALTKAGYEVHIFHLMTMNGKRPPTAELYTDTKFVRPFVQTLISQDKKVVAIMHSYGGQVGTNALHGLDVESLTVAAAGNGVAYGRGGVLHLIYMTASALPGGGSMMTMVRKFGHEDLMPLAFDFAEDMSVLCRDPKNILIGPAPDIEDAEIDAYIDTFVVWNGKCMYQEIENCASKTIPVSFIFTEGDATMPLDYQKKMVEGLEEQGREVKIFMLKTGHCPNLTATEGVVDVVEKVVARL